MSQRRRSQFPLWCQALATGIAVVAVATTPLQAAPRYTLHLMHSFCAGGACIDGDGPNDLIRDASGNFYGTTQEGGAPSNGGQGVVFELTPAGDRYSLHLLHTFCRKLNCPDGAYPVGNLVIDTGGNLYGATAFGGKSDSGVVFALTRNGEGWTYSILHSFCQGNCGGGSNPETGLSYAGQASGVPWNESSPLFGTADMGGLGNGVIYELSAYPYQYKVIHKLQSGKYPQPVLVDPGGNLIATSQGGGKYNGGVLYRLDADTWHETTLRNFCSPTDCSDGRGPIGRPVMDAAGNVFVSMSVDGANGGGTIFERPSGGGFKVAYAFCALANCADGYNPGSSLTLDGSGNLFGTTQAGGAGQSGVVFELTPGGSESVLFAFCSKSSSCPGGGTPEAGVILGSAGNIFGTTTLAGKGNAGTAFELTP